MQMKKKKRKNRMRMKRCVKIIYVDIRIKIYI